MHQTELHFFLAMVDAQADPFFNILTSLLVGISNGLSIPYPPICSFTIFLIQPFIKIKLSVIFQKPFTYCLQCTKQYKIAFLYGFGQCHYQSRCNRSPFGMCPFEVCVWELNGHKCQSMVGIIFLITTFLI